MFHFKQLHHPDFSLWQSAVEQVASRLESASERLDNSHPMIKAVAMAAEHLEANDGVSAAHVEPDGSAESGAKYCASVWWEIAKAALSGDKQAEADWRERAGKFTSCDPRYALAVQQYLDFYEIRKETPPYRRWQQLSDYIVDWPVPPKARIAVVGDWGTGQPEAVALLGAIARKNPDIVIHLGDIYYAGTEFEVENYFLDIWKRSFDLSRIRTFTLAGNHDMYSGGAPYYRLIDELGQPASYFCLRNEDWQFIALDTGLHDHDALEASPTYLEDSEVAWLADKFATAGSRRTVLLSHHQLFTAFESIGGQSVNQRLAAQVGPFLPNVDLWLWGHEHDQVIYQRHLGILGRCIGHGAYPVGITEIPAEPKFSEVPLENVRLHKGDALYAHGYAIIDLDGPSAAVSYYQDSDPESVPMWTDSLSRP